MGNRIRTSVDYKHTPSAASRAAELAGGREGYEGGVRQTSPALLLGVAMRAAGLDQQPSMFREFPESGRGQLDLGVHDGGPDPLDYAD